MNSLSNLYLSCDISFLILSLPDGLELSFLELEFSFFETGVLFDVLGLDRPCDREEGFPWLHNLARKQYVETFNLNS